MSKKKENYWTIECEDAVVDYLNDPENSEKIFEEILYPKLRHMVENIMFKYHLFDSTQSIEEQINDTLSFIMIKFTKFNPNKGFKAYSYFGTVAKHYMMMKKQIIYFALVGLTMASCAPIYKCGDPRPETKPGGGNRRSIFSRTRQQSRWGSIFPCADVCVMLRGGRAGGWLAGCAAR